MLTAQEQQELDYLSSLGAYQPATVEGFARAGQNLANLPSRAASSFLSGVAGLPQLFVPDEYKSAPIRVPEPYDIPTPTTTTGRITDFALGGVAPELVSLLMPSLAATKATRAAGLSEKASLLAGDLAAGSISAGAHQDPMAIPEFAAFGMLRPLGAFGRVAGGAGISAGTQALHGNNPFTPEGAVRTTVDALFSGIDKLPVERTPFARTHIEAPGIAPAPDVTTPLPTAIPSPETFSPDFYLRQSPEGAELLRRQLLEQEEAQYTAQTRNPFKRESTSEPVILGGTPIPEAQPIIARSVVTPMPEAEIVLPFGRGPREIIEPARIEQFKGELANIQAQIDAERSFPRRIDLQRQFDDVSNLVRQAEEFSNTTAQQGGRLGFARTAEDTASVIPETVFNREAIRRNMGSASEAGAIDLSIVSDVGRSIYQAGMDFVTWAGEMIRRFGESVKEVLEPIFKAINNPVGAVTRNPFTRTPLSPVQNKAQAGAIDISPRVRSIGRKTVDAFRELPAPIKSKLTQAEGFKSEVVGKLGRSVEQAKKIIPDMTPTETKVLRDFSRGKIDEAAAVSAGARPESVQVVKELREQTRAVQEPIVKGEANWARKKMIARTYGDHTARDYDIFVNPKDYKIDETALQDVVSEIAGQPDYRGNRIMAERDVRQILREYQEGTSSGDTGSDPRIQQHIYKKRHLTEEEKAERMRDIADDIATGRKMGHDVSELEEELKAVADSPVLTEAWRRLLGERTNPIEAKARTVAKLVTSAANAQVLTALRDVEVAPGIKGTMTPDEYNFATASASAGSKELDDLLKYDRTKENAALGVLGDRYIHPEVERAVRAVSKDVEDFMHPLIRKINSEIKTNFTVRNPATSIRNALTSPVFLMIGRNPLHTWKAALSEFRDADNAMRKEAVRMGAIGGDFVSGELIKKVENLVNFKSESKIMGSLKKLDKLTKDVYKAPDQFVRYTTYRNARKRGLSPEQAIQFVDRYTPNYGTVPQGIKVARNVPLVNPFLSYNYEIFRIMKNLAFDIGDKSMPTSERIRSAKILASVLTVPFIAKEGAEAAMTPEERKEWDRIHAMSRDYQRSQFRIPIKRRNDGTWVYVNADPFNVAGDLNKFILSAWNRDFKAMKADNPLVGLNNTPLLNVLSEVVAGESMTGKPIEGATGIARTIVRNTAPPLLGGYAGEQMVRSFTPNEKGGLGIRNERTGREDSPSYFVPTLVGVRPAQVNEPTLRRGLIFERNEKLNQAKRELKEILRSNRSPAAKDKARQAFQRKAEKIQREFLRRT